MNRVLVVEDEKELNKMICDFLTSVGFFAKGIFDGSEVLPLVKRDLFDVVLLDLMLPNKDGFAVLRDLEGLTLPGVILLTARDFEADKLKAFKLGADDYITKPFSFVELEARIKALIRRLPNIADQDKIIRRAGIELDYRTRKATLDNKELELTTYQFELLALLVTFANRVVPREQIIQKINSNGSEISDRTVDAHIKNIRRILGNEKKDLIQTVYGVGYSFVDKSSSVG